MPHEAGAAVGTSNPRPWQVPHYEGLSMSTNPHGERCRTSTCLSARPASAKRSRSSTICSGLRSLLPLTETQAANVPTAGGGVAGAPWQMRGMGTDLRNFYETEPDLAHAVVDAGPHVRSCARAVGRRRTSEETTLRPPTWRRRAAAPQTSD